MLELRGDEIEYPVRYFLSSLRISKSRYQKTALGWHQYKNRDSGIIVFPSVHFRMGRHKAAVDSIEHSRRPMAELDTQSCSDFHSGDTSFLCKFLESIARGSCTVLLGPRRCLKTQLTFDFLRAGSILQQVEPGLLVSLIDNQSTIIAQRRTLCERCCSQYHTIVDCGCKHCYQHVYLLHMPPGCITTSEFMHWLEYRLSLGELEGERIRRLVLWDLAQLEFRFPLLAKDPMFLPGLFDYLKYSGPLGEETQERRLTSVFMGPPNNELARSASAMADNVLFVWPDRFCQRGLGSAVREVGTYAAGIEGIAVYVDRVEGHPGVQRLYFARGDEMPDRTDEVPGMNFKELLDRRVLDEAPKMIAEIQALQGLRYGGTPTVAM